MTERRWSSAAALLAVVVLASVAVPANGTPVDLVWTWTGADATFAVPAAPGTETRYEVRVDHYGRKLGSSSRTLIYLLVAECSVTGPSLVTRPGTCADGSRPRARHYYGGFAAREAFEFSSQEGSARLVFESFVVEWRTALTLIEDTMPELGVICGTSVARARPAAAWGRYGDRALDSSQLIAARTWQGYSANVPPVC